MENAKRTQPENLQQGSRLLLVVSFSALLICALSGVGYTMWQQLPIIVETDQALKFPITSEGVTITKADHRWVRPHAEDQVESNTVYFPKVELTYGPATNANFICFFENNDGEVIGDGVTFTVKNGNYAGSNVHTFHCSAGYQELAHYKSYSYSEAPFWHLVIQKNVTGAAPELITKIPLPPTL